MQRIALSLAGHTNYGKTTLARTLLRAPVGKVDDRPHVTDLADGHRLAGDEEAEVVLWDLPGFGDSVRLKSRLEKGGLLGWLRLHFDRWNDRPLWCSQESLRNVRTDADVVLYVADALGDPAASPEVRAELKVLAWAGKPAILVLNQAGLPEAERDQNLESAWLESFADIPIVSGVVVLDGWMRCWLQELRLMERVAVLIPEEKREAFRRVMDAWAEKRHHHVFRATVESVTRQLKETMEDAATVEGEPWHERVGSFLMRKASPRQEVARHALAARLVERSRLGMEEMLRIHGLEGAPRERVEEMIKGWKDDNPSAPPEVWAALSAIGSGALVGLSADFLAGGLTFGGGAVVGGVLGGLSGYALGWGFRAVKGEGGETVLRWNPDAMQEELRAAALRYLAVAHLGYGHEAWKEPLPEDLPGRWRAAVDTWMEAHAAELKRGLRPGEDARLASLVESLLHDVLRDLHPDSSIS